MNLKQRLALAAGVLLLILYTSTGGGNPQLTQPPTPAPAPAPISIPAFFFFFFARPNHTCLRLRDSIFLSRLIFDSLHWCTGVQAKMVRGLLRAGRRGHLATKRCVCDPCHRQMSLALQQCNA